MSRTTWWVVLCAAAVTAGCSGDGEGTGTAAPAVTYTAEAPVILPGEPGAEAATIAPGQVASRPAAPEPNAADLEFVRGMVPHHTQALRMAKLAPGRVADARVRAIADRVSGGQAAEVAQLQGWLRSHDEPEGAAAGGHHAMPGAVSQAQLERLAAQRGPAFDRMFLDLMVAHHRGAVTMAEAATAGAADVLVQEMAADTHAGQLAEIRRMEAVRAEL